MRARVLVSCALVMSLAALAFTPSALAQHEPEELLVGNWVLDVNASRYLPGPPPRAETRIYTKQPEGIKGVVTRTQANGSVQKIEYMANTDREYMVSGTPDYDAVKLRQIDPFTSEALLTHGGGRSAGHRRNPRRIYFSGKRAGLPWGNAGGYHAVDKR